jgi:diguanylate cyclase (GGDEF)-like protein
VNDPPGGLMGIPAHELTPRVRDAIMRLLSEVDAMRRELEGTQKRLMELEKLADLDTLSPIANRRAFVRAMSQAMSHVERYNEPASVLFFDVNGLKQINDSYGHAAGDAALVHVAETLRANVRASDVVGRLGGDEFAIILTRADEGVADIKAAQLAAQVAERPVRHNEFEFPVTTAVGVYSFGPGENPTQILERADKKMYADKRAAKAAS